MKLRATGIVGMGFNSGKRSTAYNCHVMRRDKRDTLSLAIASIITWFVPLRHPSVMCPLYGAPPHSFAFRDTFHQNRHTSPGSPEFIDDFHHRDSSHHGCSHSIPPRGSFDTRGLKRELAAVDWSQEPHETLVPLEGACLYCWYLPAFQLSVFEITNRTVHFLRC